MAGGVPVLRPPPGIIQVGIEGSANENATADVAAVIATAMFFSWSEHFLLAGRVPPREVIPGGIVTALGLLGLHGFSKLFFSGMIVDQAHDYGLIGVVFVLMSWLVGACVVLAGGPAVGAVVSRRIFHPRHPHYVYHLHYWRSRRRDHRTSGRPAHRVPVHRPAARVHRPAARKPARDDPGTREPTLQKTTSRPGPVMPGPPA